MNKCFKKFQVKDFVFLAILSAAMTLCGGITMPLVMHTTYSGFAIWRQLRYMRSSALSV